MRRARVIRWALLLVAGAALLVGAALALSMTGWAGARIARRVEAEVNQRIAGKLTLGALRFRLTRVVLTGVRLDDARGERVASVERIDASVALLPLLRQRIAARALAIDRPDFALTQSADGLNLNEALKSRTPRTEPRAPGGGPSPWSFSLEGFAVKDGAFRFEQRGEGKPFVLALDGLALEGGGAARLDGPSLDAWLRIDGVAQEPASGPVRLDVTCGLDGRKQHLGAKGTVAGARLDARMEREGNDAAFVIDALEAPAALVRALAPGYPLRATASLQGTARLVGPRVTADFEGRAGAGAFKARGDFHLVTLRSEGVTVELDRIDFSELLERGPKSQLSAQLTAHGGGRDLESLEGALSLTAPPSQLGGVPFGPVELQAHARAGVVTLEKLLADLPGLKVKGQGQGASRSARLALEVAANDLALFGRTVGAVVRPGGLPLSGSGDLHVRAHGTPRAPAVQVRGQLKALAYDDVRLRGVRLEASAPDLSRLGAQQLAGTRLEATIAHAQLGGRRLRDARLRWRGQGELLALDLGVDGALALRAQATGRLDLEEKTADLRSLSLWYPDVTWTLEAPTRVTFAPGALGVDGLRLRSEEQSIAVRFEKRGERLVGAAQLKSLDLARLPKPFVPPSLGLQGSLSASVSADGRLPYPEGRAQVSVRNGAFGRYQRVRLALDAAYAQDRAVGSVDLRALGAGFESRFDLPVRSFFSGPARPASLTAKVDAFDLRELAALYPDLPLAGTAGLDVSLDGTTHAPVLRAHVRGRNLRYQQLPPTQLDALVQTDGDGALALSANAEALRGTAALHLKTPWTLAKVVRAFPSARELVEAPLSLRLEAKDLSLPAAYVGTVSQRPLLGVVHATAQLDGPLLTPMGQARVDFAGVTNGEVAPLSGDLSARFTERDVRVTAHVHQAEQPLVIFSAAAAAPVRVLRDLDRLGRTPLTVDARIGPVPLGLVQRMLGAHQDEYGHALPLLSGDAWVEAQLNGTPDDPRLTARTSIEALGTTSSSGRGNVALALDYEKARALTHLSMLSSNGGGLQSRVEAPVDLSLRALRKGVDFASLQGKGELSAERFDLSFFSGVTPALTRIGGPLDARVRLSGRLAQPWVEGDLAWRGGVLALAGTGEYRNIQLQLEGSPERIALKNLSARAGTGEARLQANAVRQGEGFSLKAAAQVRRFPIIVQDQLLATLTTEADIDGAAQSALVDLRRVRIDKAVVELPDDGRKNVQALQVAEGIVFVRNGVPIETEAAPAPKSTGVGGSGNGAPLLRLRAVLDAPRDLWVRSQDVDAEVGLSEGFTVELGQRLELSGRLMVRRGRVDALGRRFQLQNTSNVAFAGPLRSANVNIEAEHINELEDVTVRLAIRGTPDHLDIVPTSQPPMSESEIFTLLATGRRDLRSGRGGATPAEAATSILGSFLANRLTSALQTRLPLDVLSIQTRGEGLSGTRVQAGKYLSDRLYIEGRVGARTSVYDNTTEVHFEYLLFRRLSLEGQYGDNRQGGLDLIWSYDW